MIMTIITPLVLAVSGVVARMATSTRRRWTYMYSLHTFHATSLAVAWAIGGSSASLYDQTSVVQCYVHCRLVRAALTLWGGPGPSHPISTASFYAQALAHVMADKAQ